MAGLQIVENRLHSPILRQLPPEIISHIFNFTLLDFSIFTNSFPKMNPKHPSAMPFILGAVCKDWRAITWSTPVLWSSMVVYFSQSTLNTRSILMKDWFSRSGQLPLSIRIIFNRPIKLSPKVIADLGFLAGIINQYSSRWCHFELSAPSKIATYFRAEGFHAPMLESLRLAIHGRITEFDPITCPRLEKVHLAYVRPSVINFSWNNVTHICAKALFFEDYFEILQNTPLLVHAEFIDANAYEIHVPYPTGGIITPLRSLKVVGICASFFRYITCPALDELSWSKTISSRPYIDTDDIIPFLQRSGRLHSFTMFFVPGEHWRLLDLLQAMPSLNTLALEQHSSRMMEAENILEVLGMIQSSQSNFSHPKFLPDLETLEYTGPFNPAKMDLPIIISPNFFPSTNNAVQGPLQSVKLSIIPEIRMPKNVVAFFLRLVERGVTVKVWSPLKDILQSSINYYERKEESLRRDWVDNLDLSLMQDLS